MLCRLHSSTSLTPCGLTEGVECSLLRSGRWQHQPLQSNFVRKSGTPGSPSHPNVLTPYARMPYLPPNIPVSPESRTMDVPGCITRTWQQATEELALAWAAVSTGCNNSSVPACRVPWLWTPEANTWSVQPPAFRASSAYAAKLSLRVGKKQSRRTMYLRHDGIAFSVLIAVAEVLALANHNSPDAGRVLDASHLVQGVVSQSRHTDVGTINLEAAVTTAHINRNTVPSHVPGLACNSVHTTHRCVGLNQSSTGTRNEFNHLLVALKHAWQGPSMCC